MSTSKSTNHTKIPNTNYFQKRSSLLRCFWKFFSYVICFYENLFTVNYFGQNKVVLTYGHLSCLPLFLHQVKMFFITFQMKCPMSIRVRCKDGETLEITNIVHEHNHEVSKAAFSHLFHQRRLDSG